MKIDVKDYFTNSIPQLKRKISLFPFCAGSSHLVQVTHINNPHSFYVRISCLRYAVKLLEVCGRPIKLTDLTVGQIVVYKSQTVRHNVRGCIQRINICERGQGLVCAIVAIDYGFLDTHVTLRNIFMPEIESLDVGPLAFHCKLNACEPLGDKFDAEAVHAMKFFVGSYTVKVFVVHNVAGQVLVQMRTVECPEDIATVLYRKNFTRKEKQTDIEPVTKQEIIKYKHRTVKPGDHIHIRVENGYTIFDFYAADVDDYNEYNDGVESFKLTQYCSEQPSLNINEAALDGRACGVRIPNSTRFERAIVKEVTEPNARAIVHLIDWGRKIEVNFEDIKPVSEDFTECPAMALYLAADRMLCLNYGIAIQKICPGLEFIAEILEIGNGFRIPHRVRLVPLFPLPPLMLTDDEDEDD